MLWNLRRKKFLRQSGGFDFLIVVVYNIGRYKEEVQGSINMPLFKIMAETVAVPAEFIENHMVRANGSYVKVYLYALMLAARGARSEQADIAKSLNLLESDVKNAFDYWKSEGLLSFDGDTIILGSETRRSADGETRVNAAEAARIMNGDESLREMITLAQSMLGKTLNSRDLETLYWMYDGLGLSPDAVLMVIEYCVSKDKRSVGYAEKVAVTWCERGINTIEAIEAHIKLENERANYFYSLRKLFGISDRPLSKKEEEYLRKWNDEFGMDEDMVALAYEYCIMQTNKLSFPYMDTILANWKAKNIRTVEAAEREHSQFKSPRSEKNFNVYNDNVDHSELEQLMRQKYDS